MTGHYFSCYKLNKKGLLVTAHAVTLWHNDKINYIINKNENIGLAFVCLGHGMIRDQQ
jgi:hypothetical protein